MQIELIDLSNNCFTGTIPQLNSYALDSMDLSTNQFIGTLPDFRDIPVLSQLDVSNNNLTGTLPKFTRFKRLRLFKASGNQFTGAIPNYEFGSAFTHLQLQNNMLTAMPEEFPDTLLEIDLRYNLISGDFPRLYLEQLSILRLGFNSFQGTFPECIFPAIRTLDIRQNNFSSSFPELLNVDKLEVFDASQNRFLSGPIPAVFDESTSLLQLNIEGTMMRSQGQNPLPSFVHVSGIFSLQSSTDNYHCANLESKYYKGGSQIIMDPIYHNFTFCNCLPGYFGWRNRCLPCPMQCDCPDGKSINNCVPSPSTTDPHVILQCPLLNTCSTQLNQDVVFDEDEDIKTCTAGYQGRVCSQCDQGYGKFGRTCSKCDNELAAALICIAVVIFLAIVWYLFRNPPEASGSLSVFLSHLQALSVLSYVLVDSPKTETAVDVSFSIGSITLPSIYCIFDTVDVVIPALFDYLRIPVLVILSCALSLVAGVGYRDRVIGITALLLNSMYYSMSRQVFSAFGCTLYDEGIDSWYLTAYPWVSCSPVSSEHGSLLAIAFVTIFTCLVPMPWTIYHYLHKPRDCDSLLLQRRFGVFYMAYKEEYRLWSLVSMARGLALSFCISVIPYDNPALLYCMIFVVIQFFIWMQQRKRPFRLKQDNDLESTSLYILYVSFLLAVLSAVIPDQSWVSAAIISLNAVFFALYARMLLLGLESLFRLRSKTLDSPEVIDASSPTAETL
eukprot:TRINITY_DN8500_c0_g1_i2.p1 TRINITY_DN8500_c0_g1~~TRINITY_DN8500_c0_g1_i2.p1  ORF type:complete len:726 (+),score=117.93 TRINITY_DN8500_c0_g1_i2:447-2624(+)